MNTETFIDYGKGGTSFVGHDAVEFFRAAALASALSLYAKTSMIPNRGLTITKMLTLATQITKKPYKRGEAQKAADDVRAWAQELKAALPVRVEGKPS